MRALTASWLIALDSPWCILCKVVALVTQTDLENICGVAQLCSRLWAGMEGAIHAVCELFDLHSDDSWGFACR